MTALERQKRLSALLAPVTIWRRLRSPARFVLPISPCEWAWLLRIGWPGSDGSSVSLDSILGVRIGESSRSFMSACLPANTHDFLYELGRIFELDETYREAADELYRSGCSSLVSSLLPTVSAAIGRAIAWSRWVGLRAFAGPAWRGTPHAPAPRSGSWRHV